MNGSWLSASTSIARSLAARWKRYEGASGSKLTLPFRACSARSPALARRCSQKLGGAVRMGIAGGATRGADRAEVCRAVRSLRALRLAAASLCGAPPRAPGSAACRRQLRRSTSRFLVNRAPTARTGACSAPARASALAAALGPLASRPRELGAARDLARAPRELPRRARRRRRSDAKVRGGRAARLLAMWRAGVRCGAVRVR